MDNHGEPFSGIHILEKDDNNMLALHLQFCENGFLPTYNIGQLRTSLMTTQNRAETIVCAFGKLATATVVFELQGARPPNSATQHT